MEQRGPLFVGRKAEGCGDGVHSIDHLGAILFTFVVKTQKMEGAVDGQVCQLGIERHLSLGRLPGGKGHRDRDVPQEGLFLTWKCKDVRGAVDASKSTVQVLNFGVAGE